MAILLRTLSRSRFIWGALVLIALILEACGLYFQYVLELPPCVNCVYERAFILGFLLAGVIGVIGAPSMICRLLGCLVLLGSALGGLRISYTHYLSQFPEHTGVCQLRAHYPDFLPLDKLLPWMFKPHGACGPLDWSLLGLSMPDWLLITFAVAALAALTGLLNEFFNRAQPTTGL